MCDLVSERAEVRGGCVGGVGCCGGCGWLGWWSKGLGGEGEGEGRGRKGRGGGRLNFDGVSERKKRKGEKEGEKKGARQLWEAPKGTKDNG